MVTLREVAAYAGVSTATVSCCISGAKTLKPATKRKVQEAIAALKYIPNTAARRLKSPESNEIGVVLTDIDDWYHAEIFKGVAAFTQKNKLNINIAFSNNLPQLECDAIDNLIGKNVAGLLVITCQPQNSGFLKSRIAAHSLPAVFIERKPAGMDCNYAGFNNHETITYVVNQLLNKGYKRFAMILGNDTFTSEQQCLRGYTQALEKHQGQVESTHMCTNMSKEDAFRAGIATLREKAPQAVITTSTGIAKGVLEAAQVLGLRLGKDFMLITLGEECWNVSNQLDGVIHTARAAFALGSAAAELLAQNMRSPYLFELQTLRLQDGIVQTGIDIPPCPPPTTRVVVKKNETLRILMMELNTSDALQTLAAGFTRETGVQVEMMQMPQDKMLHSITDEKNSHFDIFMYDIPWTDYLAQNHLVADITSFVQSKEFNRDSLLKENLSNCVYRNRFYGIPIVGGAQILFYRKDAFENPQLQRSFEAKYKTRLRPPKTWKEFNGMAEFFTQENNPDSPFLYGTSMAGINNQELAPEILIRLNAHGGQIFDAKNHVTLNSSKNVRAFKSMLQTLDYVPRLPQKTSIKQTVQDFLEGKTSMLITYTEYASILNSSDHSKILGKVGYSVLPGRSPIHVGWNLGMNTLTNNHENVYAFFKWVCRKDTSYYLTIINGQSAMVYPYQNNELLKLYPWMNQSMDSFPYCQRRGGPEKADAMVIPQSKLEEILCNIFYKVSTGEQSVEDALAKGHVEMKHLFRYYGYGSSVMCNYERN